MIRFIDALVLKTPRLEETISFYRTIGLPFEEEKHEEGPIHFTCDLEKLHFSIYPTTPEESSPGNGIIGFEVDSVEEVLEKARQWGARVIVDFQEVPWGVRAIVLDPDGRKVEFNRSTKHN